MKTLKINSAQNITTEEVPVPEPGAGEVRVRMMYGGICGSDLHYYFEGRNGAFEVREPMTPGHEMSGVVDLDPSGTYAPGTPVTIAPATFGTWPHTQGGMSEYHVVKDFMIRGLPEGLSLRDASLAEPLAVGLHAIEMAGGVQGKKVLVTGSGPIGLLLAAGAVAKGAAEVTCTDVLDGPLERAKAVGVQHTIRVDKEQIPEMAYDVVFECSGVAPAITPAIAAVRRAGTVAQVGMLPNDKIAVNLAAFVTKEVSYIGCFRFNDEIGEAIELLASNPKIANVITHVIAADEIENAFDTAKNSQESGKVVVALWPEA